MPPSPKSAMLALGAMLGAAAQTAAQEKAAPATKKPVKDSIKITTKDAKIGKLKPKEDAELDLPMPRGEPQHGVKIPLYDADGKLKMRFEIGTGTYVDDENIKLTQLRVETFKEDGTRDMDMDLPDAVLNKKTKDLTSKVEVHIKREDFEVTGNSMTYNLGTGQGTLGGGVKMIIYNLKKESRAGKPKDETTTIEITPKKEEKK